MFNDAQAEPSEAEMEAMFLWSPISNEQQAEIWKDCNAIYAARPQWRIQRAPTPLAR